MILNQVSRLLLLPHSMPRPSKRRLSLSLTTFSHDNARLAHDFVSYAHIIPSFLSHSMPSPTFTLSLRGVSLSHLDQAVTSAALSVTYTLYPGRSPPGALRIDCGFSLRKPSGAHCCCVLYGSRGKRALGAFIRDSNLNCLARSRCYQ